MTLLIPDDIHEPIPYAIDALPAFELNSSVPSIHSTERPESVKVEDSMDEGIKKESPLHSDTHAGAKDVHVATATYQQSATAAATAAPTDDSKSTQMSSRTTSTLQPLDESNAKPSESGEDSAKAAAHPPSQAPGSHHAHYAQYYHSYPHGHSYYYPPGHYYPPPPHGHSSYSHASHASHAHYYAHYPHHAGYYSHPHYHYYSHPPSAATSVAPEMSSSRSATTSSSPTNSLSSSKDSAKTVSSKSHSQTHTSTNAKNARPNTPHSRGPYSAFTTPAPKDAKPISQRPQSKPLPKPCKSTKPTSKVPSTVVTTSKNKRKQIPETEAIFRVKNKRTKHLAAQAQSKAAAAAVAAKEAKAKVQPRQVSQTVLDRRSRKNAQSRLRAAKLKQRISEIQAKEPNDRSQEEMKTLKLYEERRQRKNGRSRERALERKKEYERIMKISEEQWTTEEKSFVEETMLAKFKKNEGDRLRRKKLKEEADSTGSVSSEWDSSTSTCKGSARSFPAKKKAQQTKRKTKANDEIPNYIESSSSISVEEEKNDDTILDHQSFLHKDVPLTPISQKEAFSLLESTPTIFFGSTTDPNKNSTDCFSPNFIFPSPSRKSKDLSAHMDAIDFDALELHTDGTSILDPSMAMTIDDEVIYSPNLGTSALGESPRAANNQHAIPQLSSNMRLSPLNLPRRSRHISHEDDNFSPVSEDFPDDDHYDDFGGYDGVASKAIAVSFSVDTA